MKLWPHEILAARSSAWAGQHCNGIAANRGVFTAGIGHGAGFRAPQNNDKHRQHHRDAERNEREQREAAGNSATITIRTQ
jgi:hypothetical protein